MRTGCVCHPWGYLILQLGKAQQARFTSLQSHTVTEISGQQVAKWCCYLNHIDNHALLLIALHLIHVLAFTRGFSLFTLLTPLCGVIHCGNATASHLGSTLPFSKHFHTHNLTGSSSHPQERERAGMTRGSEGTDRARAGPEHTAQQCVGAPLHSTLACLSSHGSLDHVTSFPPSGMLGWN